MATQLFKLRNVPEDEVLDVCELLEQNGIEYYETTAGNWGISMPALWARNDAQVDQAKALLKEYAVQRQARARAEYEALKNLGQGRSWLDIALEKPIKFILYLIVVVILAGISILPFINLIKD